MRRRTGETALEGDRITHFALRHRIPPGHLAGRRFGFRSPGERCRRDAALDGDRRAERSLRIEHHGSLLAKGPPAGDLDVQIYVSEARLDDAMEAVLFAQHVEEPSSTKSLRPSVRKRVVAKG